MSAAFVFSDALALTKDRTLTALAARYGISRRDLKIPRFELRDRGLAKLDGDSDSIAPTSLTYQVAAAKVRLTDLGAVGDLIAFVVPPLPSSPPPRWQVHTLRKIAEPNYTGPHFFPHIEHALRIALLPPGVEEFPRLARIESLVRARTETDADVWPAKVFNETAFKYMTCVEEPPPTVPRGYFIQGELALCREYAARFKD